jgi:beta-glucanase (GH16 family)
MMVAMLSTLFRIMFAIAMGATLPMPDVKATLSRDIPTWADEFNGAAQELPDAKWWTLDLGNEDSGGWGNRELQFYTGDVENVSLDGQGRLLIVAQSSDDGSRSCWNGLPCPWTSARITTQDTVALRYGWAEARIRLPNGRGLWSAFWMLGVGDEPWPGNGEIDVMESLGHDLATVYGTAHLPGYANDGGIGGEYTLDRMDADDFHTFAVDKQPGSITWYVDGAPYHTITRETLPDDAQWVFDRPFYLLLNLAVGGDWPGSPDATTGFPATMTVDYIRLYGDVVLSPRAT